MLRSILTSNLAARIAPFAVAVSALFSVACTSVGSSAVRTDGGWTQKHMGPVRIYAVVLPDQVRVVGMVEVHAVNDEANFERLIPVFMKRVADIGATGGIIDHVNSWFEMRTEWRTESYAIPCGYRSTCWSTRVVPYTYQVRILSIQGRALLPIDAPGPPAITDQIVKPGATPVPTASPPGPTRPDQAPPATSNPGTTAPTPQPTPSKQEGGVSL